MVKGLLKFLRPQYRVLNRIEISRSALLNNYSQLSALNPKLKIAPVLKSNAYGHGIVEVAKILDPKPPFFCVDSLFEAYELHKAKIKTPILIMGYTDPQNLKVKKLPFQWAVWDSEFARALNKYQPGAKIHLFVDTGMHREGVLLENLASFLETLKQNNNLTIIGLMSHLASSESTNDPLFKRQTANFQKAKEIVQNQGLKLDYFHLGASNCLINEGTRAVIAKLCNLSRVGKALYGLAPKQPEYLKPILKMTTQIIQVKEVKKGERVGYDGTYAAPKSMLLGVLPLGYHDGLDRRLSNKGVVLVDGAKCPIIGRVSMNITTIDLSAVKNPHPGQEVIVYSNHPQDPNCIEKAASLCGTIAHEILVHETPSTRRVVVD